MKKTLLFIAILLFTFQLINGQTSSAPSSTIIDASQMLSDVKILSADDMQGRQVETPGGAKARDYIVGRFNQAGLQSFGDSYLHNFEFTGQGGKKINGINIVGYIKGNKNSDKYIIVTAHYDHVGVRNGAIYNGADDNASGVGALLAMAKYFDKNRPNNSIIFVALDAEEVGLQGAKKFVEKMPVKKESVLINVNMDMVSRSDKNELYASGTYHYPNLKPYLEAIAKTSAVKLLLGHDQPNPPQDDWTTQSDHAAFHQVKIPFIYFGVEDHKDYHRPTDDFESVNQTFFVRAVETILSAVKSFDTNLSK